MTTKSNVPKRTRTQLTKTVIRKIANDVVAQQVESGISAARDLFVVKVLQETDRTPTEGEIDSFMKEISDIATALKKRVR
jgi:voltage-gated potassium channel Kch